MMKWFKATPKIINCPIRNWPINVGPVIQLVETREFQILADKLQLGMTYLVFRSATHSRFTHSIGVYDLARRTADNWVKWGFITKEEANAIAVHGLWHDIGHPAFSHVTEDFCQKDNNQMSHEVANNLKQIIAKAGVNAELAVRLIGHEHPLHCAVSDKNLGADKSDYLERDGWYAIQSRPMGINAVREHTYFIDGQIVVDKKVVDCAMHLQDFYIEMYKSVYLRKSLVIAQRMFHKMVHHLIKGGEVRADELYGMTDTELMARAIYSPSERVCDLYQKLRNRTLLKEAIVVRPEKFIEETRIANKPIIVIPANETIVKQLVKSPILNKKNHEALQNVEDAMADVAGIPRGSVVVVPVFNPERFRVQDIKYWDSGRKKIYSLKEARQERFTALEQTFYSYWAFRICTTPQYRKHLASKKVASKVLSLVL